MSALLDEIIRQRREKAIEYEEYLQQIADLAARVKAGKSEDTPAGLDSKGKLALYNNLKDRVPANTIATDHLPYLEHDPALELTLKIDAAIKESRPDGWRGVQAKENVIKMALYDVLHDVAEVERIFQIIFAQPEY